MTDEQTPRHIRIFLTPVASRPGVRKITPPPTHYDTYYTMTEELKQMAAGIDEHTAVFINLKDTLLKEYDGQENIDH